MEQLTAGNGVVRINCGGSEIITPNGTAWSRDCCSREGKPIGPEPSSNDAAAFRSSPFYTTHRYSDRDPRGPVYRIPLPAGTYRVTLHFAELFFGVRMAGERRFHVSVQGVRFLRDYRPTPRKPEAKTVPEPVSIEEGFLDIEYAPGARGFPMISGIEIEKL